MAVRGSPYRIGFGRGAAFIVASLQEARDKALAVETEDPVDARVREELCELLEHVEEVALARLREKLKSVY